MELEVDVGLVAEFMKWFFYQLYHADFMRVKIVEDRTFAAIYQMQMLALNAGQDVSAYLSGLEEDAENAINAIRDEFKKLLKLLDEADRRAQLMSRILSNPNLLQYSTPETKGMIIYQLTRHGNPDWADVRNHKGLLAFGRRKDAIKQVLLWAQTRRECDNIIQHMSADGAKGNFQNNFKEIVRFFAMEAPKGIDLPVFNSTYDEDFLRWYQTLQERLKEAPTRGYKVAQNDAPEYQKQMIAMSDHPRFNTMMV